MVFMVIDTVENSVMSQKSIEKGLAFADKLLSKDVSKQKLSQEDADSARAKLIPTTKMEDLDSVDMVIEAVPEILDLKTKIFAQLAGQRVSRRGGSDYQETGDG